MLVGVGVADYLSNGETMAELPKNPTTPTQSEVVESSPKPYSPPRLTRAGSTTELLQRQPSGGAADRAAKKPVIAATKKKKAKKKVKAKK